MNYLGRTVMITGGGSGIGALSGLRFAEAGANVALLDVNEIALEENAEKIRKINGKVLTLKVDIRNFSEIEAAEKKIVETFGSLDILLNCAGGMSGRCCNNFTSFEKLPIHLPSAFPPQPFNI